MNGGTEVAGGPPAAGASGISWGRIVWLIGGLYTGISILLMATAGLAILPLVVPAVALGAILVETRAPGRVGAVVGLVIAVDLFALSLVLAPPCIAPLLIRTASGGLREGCAAYQSMAGVGIGAVAATIAIGGLLWARARGRASDLAGDAAPPAEEE